MDRVNLQYYELLKEVFKEARKIIEQSNKELNRFLDREIKLTTDQELDTFFITYFEKNTNLPTYSEESLGDKKFLTEKCWIIDPLDGSFNFFRGIPFYASSIALWDKGQPVLGGIYDYVHNEFYYGEIGVGAFLNGKPIELNSAALSKGIKATGIPSFANIHESLKMFESSLSEYKKLRWLGCASLSLAYVASGKMDCYEELGIKIWDVGAGIPLVLAAGGRAEFSYNPDGSINLLAFNKMVVL